MKEFGIDQLQSRIQLRGSGFDFEWIVKCVGSWQIGNMLEWHADGTGLTPAGTLRPTQPSFTRGWW